jgi:retron-type reverse transcriptase
MLAHDIQDGRLLNLIRLHLQAGVLEDWTYHATYSGTPQGGVLSPLLSNIYLHALDEFVEDTLIPHYTCGKRRVANPAYTQCNYRIRLAQERGDLAAIVALKRERRRYPTQHSHDPHYRRLRYIRYADDFILGFSGPKREAEAIKAQVQTFLRDALKLDLHTEKTLITHARTAHARFLGYAVSIYHANDKIARREADGYQVRSINGKVRLGIPQGLIAERIKPYVQRNTIQSIPYLLQTSVPGIIQTFQSRYRGLAE